jgi:tetratricopeptide (TPR) repeat protein
LAAGIGAGSFKLETITKVGFRLLETPERSERLTCDRSRPAQPGVSRRLLISASAAAACMAAGRLWWLAPGGRRDPTAQSYYERGIALRGQASVEQTEQSVAYLREATRLDQHFGDAWGALAWGYRALLDYGPRPDAPRLESLARAAAARALELDRDNVDAKATLLLLGSFYRRWSTVESGCRELLRTAKANSLLEYNLAWLLVEVGRFREALPMFQGIAKREPFWPLVHSRIAMTLHTIGRLDEAERLLDDSLRRWPRRLDFWLGRLRQYLLAGQIREAEAFAYQVSSRPFNDDPLIRMELMLMRALRGSAADRRAELGRLTALATAPNQYVAAVHASSILGETDHGMTILEGFFFGRGPFAAARPQRLGTGFLFTSSAAALRKHRNFLPLLHEIGLHDYWRTSRSTPDFLRHA